MLDTVLGQCPQHGTEADPGCQCIPLTQGYKVSLRQLGYALNVYDGLLSVFLTIDFARFSGAIGSRLPPAFYLNTLG